MGWLTGGVIVLALALLLAVQTRVGSQQVGETLLALFNPFEGADIEVGRIGGNWISTLQLYDVNVTRADTTRLAHVDTLRLRYRLWSLWSKRLHIRDAVLAGPTVTLQQQADATWDLLNALGLSEPDTTPAAPGAFVVQVDDLRLDDGALSARFYAPGRDSTLRIDDVTARLGGLVLGDDPALRLDTLRAVLTPPGSVDSIDAQVRASVADGHVSLATFRLDARGSSVNGGGSLRLPDETHDEIYDVDLVLHAAPLALQTLYPFVPTRDAAGSADLDVRLQGTFGLLDVEAEARFSDGARFTLGGELTPAIEGALTYRLDGQVRGLDPSFFTGDPAAAGRINADLHADLHGAALDSLSGVLDADLFDTRYGDYAFDRTTLRTTFAGGEATIDLNTGLRGLNLFVDGTLRPLDPTLAYDLRGRFDSLDTGRFVEGQSSNLRGAFHVTGRGFDLEQAGLTATLDLDASRINRYRLRTGNVTARLDGQTLRFSSELRFPEGLVTAGGDVYLGETPRYEIREGRFDNLDVAALLGDTTRSAFSGTFALHGRGADPATMILDSLRLDLADSFFGPYQINRTRLSGALRQGRLTLEALVDLDGGAFDLAGTVRPFDERPGFSLTRAVFEHVDVGALGQRAGQRSDLNGTLRLAGNGFDPATMTLDEARLILFDSQLNDQRIDTTRIDATLRQGRLTFDALLATPEGTSTVAGAGTPFDEPPTFSLTEGTLSGLNLGALLGLPHLDTHLYGIIDTLDVRGVDLQTMTLRAGITLAESTVNNEKIVEGAVSIGLAEGYARAEADVRLEQGRIRLDSLQGRFFDERPTYAAAGAMTNVDLARLSGIDTLQLELSADFEVAGEGFDPATMRLTTGRLDAKDARYHDIRVGTLRARFSLNDGLLGIDTLTVRSNVAEAAGSGPVALFDTAGVHASNFILEGKLLDERPLRRFVDAEVFSLGEGTFRGRVFGDPGTLRFDARASVGGVIYNDVRVLELDAFASGTLNDDRTLSVGDVSVELSRFSIPTLAVRYSEFRAAYEGDEITFSANATVDSRRDARLEGHVELGGEDRQIVLEDLSMHLDQDRWALLQEASITYGDTYRISNFLLFEENQEIAIDGVIDPDGEQSLVLTVLDFRIGAIADLFNFPGLDGTLNGDLVLGGPGKAPVVTGTLDLDAESFGTPVGALHVDVDYDSLRLNLDATLTHQDAGTLTLAGYLPLDLRLNAGDDLSEGPPIRLGRQRAAPESEVSLRLDADQFNIGWIEPFLDPDAVNEVEGTLTAHATISGTLEDPVLAGEGVLNDGRLGLPTLGLTYRNVRADVELSDDQVLVKHLELHSGDGSLIADGTVDFPELTLGEFDLTASAEDFRAIDTRDYRATIAGNFDLRGTTRSPILAGRVELQSADIYLTEETAAAEFGPVELTEEDLQMLERHFGIRVTEADTTTFVLYDALEIEDLTVEMGRDVWLRSPKNPEMNIQFTGEVDVQKQPHRDQQLFGTVRVLPDRSFIKQFGRRFNIVNDPTKSANTLTFNGPATDPLLDLAADYKVRSRRSQDNDITISLIVKGRLDDLETELKCYDDTRNEECTLNTADLISYIATGRPAGEAFQQIGVDTGAQLAFDQLTSLIASAAGAELGLDVVEIQQEGTKGTTVTAGKYLSRRFFASVSWPISFSSGSSQQASTTAAGSAKEVTIEYELFNWLLMRMISDGSRVEFNLLYEYAY